MRTLTRLVFVLVSFVVLGTLHGQDDGPVGGVVCPSVCAKDVGQKTSCVELYGAWPGHAVYGCSGSKSCTPVNGVQECNGWSVRVDKIVAITETVWDRKYTKLTRVFNGSQGKLTDCPVSHQCYVQIGCRSTCIWDDDEESWVCRPDFGSQTSMGVTEERLKNVPCTGPFDT